MTLSFLAQNVQHGFESLTSLGESLGDAISQGVNLRTARAQEEHPSQVEQGKRVTGPEAVSLADGLGQGHDSPLRNIYSDRVRHVMPPDILLF
jgi:hypothetical protein